MSDLSCTLLSLSIESIGVVFAHADIQTILRVRQTCKKLLELIDLSLELQYKIELAKSGMKENTDACGFDAITIAERLDKVKGLSARSTTKLTSCCDCTITERTFVVPDSDGQDIRILLPENVQTVPAHESSRAAGVVACCMLYKSDHCILNVWCRDSCSWKTCGLRFDGSQLTSNPILRFKDTFLFMSWTNHSSWNITSWDFESGFFNDHTLSYSAGIPASSDCVFLSEKLVLRGDLECNSISIFELESNNPGDTDEMGSAAPIQQLHRVLRLTLPSLKAGKRYSQIVVHASSEHERHPKSLFYQDPKHQIVMIGMELQDTGDLNSRSYVALAIKMGTFLQLLSTQYTHPRSNGHSVPDVPWEFWGQGNNRLIPLPPKTDLSLRAQDQTLCVSSTGVDGKEREIEYDFNLAFQSTASTHLGPRDFVNPDDNKDNFFTGELGNQLSCLVNLKEGA